MFMRCLSWPSLPTACVTRVVSFARRSLTRAISLKASAIFPLMPVNDEGIRTEKSPCLNDSIALSSDWENWSRSPAPGPAAWPRAGAGSSVDAELVIGLSIDTIPRQNATLTPRWPDSVSVPYTAPVRFRTVSPEPRASVYQNKPKMEERA